MLKKLLPISILLTLILTLFVGCGCSNGVSDEQKDQKRKDVQLILNKNKIPLQIKRDELNFELTETQNTIVLQNKSQTKDKGTVFVFRYMKWNQQQEDEKDNNIRKNIDSSQKLTKKFPSFKKGKIKKIKKKAMYVQYGKIKKGKFNGWHGAEISFQDETDKNNKQLLLVYLITRNKKAKKQVIKFTKDFLTYDARHKDENKETTAANMFEDLGK